ncbi:MAG: formate--tetrahydrofolate ligase [Rhodospirillaceae bacterium]|nr:formate--tetrahydrofolate ligase [Rhodospirillaceae bacterium]MBT4719977.1 formate--tetrahydrofolate ligase [Rhodospirillaceae bacterium]MBT4748273.1 formate--tetrahydrofolate ligase [Rhodospirillaceae bacterium]MBT5180999.1 formate--tetrahydrofolate ligase [Rhodospirillaceae bacterium]MBT6291941.1 formate--tetrahydrofolate ligase [Rhodospirillaceae bacterium]
MNAKSVPSDLEIARDATPAPIQEIADKLGLDQAAVLPYGRAKAKIDLEYLASLNDRPDGKLVLVTGMTPTPAGEGKTTTTVGLGDALNRMGKKTAICLREPSLGPCFGMKGGAAGGGYAQVIPMEDINLHFTGDFHAIGSAHNLLSAMLDNHIYWGNALGIDSRRISWRRVVDLNDRALRTITGSLGGVANGYPREDHFDITVASEVMAIFCLARDLADLGDRLGNIQVGETRDREPVTARQLEASGSMTALLKDALMPNLVQTLEGNPAFVHGGPFANIAHGCNSVIATRAGMKTADYTITEAGFGSDLGAEKFFDIKCRKAGLAPDAVVLVATIRALKMHGGVARDQLGAEDLGALGDGLTNLTRHIENLQQFGIPVTVALNRFSSDTDAEIALVLKTATENGIDAVECTHWADGGAGTEALAARVVDNIESNPGSFKFLYEDDLPLWEKIETIAKRIYRAADVTAVDRVHQQIKAYQDAGYGDLPICMAKTPLSLSADPKLLGAPDGHEVHIREVRLSAGAGFLVAICGDIMTMPGLPRVPAANNISVNETGQIEGLF